MLLPELLLPPLLLLLLLGSFGCDTLSLTNLAAEQQELLLAEQQHVSFQSVRRMLRDENASAGSLRGELRFIGAATSSRHALHKRQVTAAASAVVVLNLTQQGLTAYDAARNYQGQGQELVTHLDLSRNHLSSLKLEQFVQLQQLDASSNVLTTLPVVSATLMTLDLSCNRLDQLSAECFFAQPQPQLLHLNLAHNQLSNISRQAFYNLQGLQTLLLSNNRIEDIDYETFLALPNLQHLDLSQNRLRGTAIRALQGIPDLVSLSIANNPQVGAAMQEFVATWSLKELDASGTGLCQVPAALAQSVRTLKLAHNWLKAINCGDLDSYPLLQYLDLSYSRIAHLEDDALGRLELLELLFLDHNLLQRVPNSLPPSLEHLFLQHNHIMELQPQAFAGLSNLKTLELSGNRLLYLPALTLPKLQTLNLQSSGIESVSQSIVHTLPQLRDLLLEDNPVRCSDLLSIAEWASPCRSPDLGLSPGRIDLKQRFEQEQNFYEHFNGQCGGAGATAAAAAAAAAAATANDAMPPTCGTAATTTAAAATATAATMPKVHKSKAAPAAATVVVAATTTTAAAAAATTQSTAKTLGPAETTSLAKLQRQQMLGMPTATTAAAAATTAATLTATTTAAGMPSLPATRAAAANRTNILATAPATSSAPTPPAAAAAAASRQTATTTAAAATATTTDTVATLTLPTNISDVAAVARMPQTTAATTAAAEIATATATAAAEIATATTETVNVPQTILDVATQQQQQRHFDNAASSSLLKATATAATATTATATATIDGFKPRETSGQEAPPLPQQQQHKHAMLQLHIKDRHLIGTPLLMHKGDNLLVDAEQLLLPGTATVADAETLEGSQQQQQQQQLRQEATDKRQPEVIKGDTKATASAEQEEEQWEGEQSKETFHGKLKKPSLSIMKMTYSTKHGTTTAAAAAAATAATETATRATIAVARHQHSSVNTPNAVPRAELSTFAQLKAFVELKTEASKSAQLLDTRLEQPHTLPAAHPGLMLLLACILMIVLLAGLAHVYRCELPWQRRSAAGHLRPHQQRAQLSNSNGNGGGGDDVHSFLHYQGSSGTAANPAQLQTWHHSTRREAPYSSPLHNLQARELQREQQKLQFYSASLEGSNNSGSNSSSNSNSNNGNSSGSSRSSLHSPCQEDAYYIEMAPSTPHATANHALSQLPMELLGHSRAGNGRSTSTVLGAATTTTTTTAAAAAAASTGATLRSVSHKLMAPSSRRLGIW